MSTYEDQLQQAWKTGDFKTETAAWAPPAVQADTQDPLAVRSRLRSEIENIVAGGAEGAARSAARKEGSMKLAKFVKFREEKFGGVLFETRNEKVYTLNPTGAAVVREIVGGAEDVVASLKIRYDDQSGALEAQAREFLADLQAKGLVE